MPHRTRKDTKEIQNVCFPIISEFSAELKECIMQKYEETVELQHKEKCNKKLMSTMSPTEYDNLMILSASYLL